MYQCQCCYRDCTRAQQTQSEFTRTIANQKSITMGFKRSLISKVCIAWLCVLYCFENKAVQAVCPASGRRTLISVLHALPIFNLGTCDVIDDYTPYLTSHLDTCTFTPQPGKTMFGQCQAACNRNRDCLAMYLTTGSGCELCLATASGAGGNGNIYDVSTLLLMAEPFRDFING